MEVYVYVSGVNKFSRILGTTSRRQRVTGSNFHIKDPQILGGNVKIYSPGVCALLVLMFYIAKMYSETV
jgi:hypothetical protein